MISPDEYVQASFLAREVAKEMGNRLDWMKLNPKQIIDVGCGVGTDTQALALRYPQAQIWGIDLLPCFLQYGKKQESRVEWMVADAQILPLRSHSVDLIFANLLLPWVNDPVFVLREWRRVLRPEGLVFFSCLGPDTFKEWKTSETATFLPGLVDMHNVGDALLEQGFTDPVLEVENLTLTYHNQAQCQFELEKSGMVLEGRLLATSSQAVFPVTFEVIYGHAWCPLTKGFKADDQGVARIPVSQLRSINKK